MHTITRASKNVGPVENSILKTRNIDMRDQYKNTICVAISRVSDEISTKKHFFCSLKSFVLHYVMSLATQNQIREINTITNLLRTLRLYPSLDNYAFPDEPAKRSLFRNADNCTSCVHVCYVRAFAYRRAY